MVRAPDDRKGTPGITEWSRARVHIDPAVCYLNFGVWRQQCRPKHRLISEELPSRVKNKGSNSEGSGKMELTEIQRELLIGSLLGDGHLRKHGKKVVFEFSQSPKRKFYVEWKHRILGELACPKIYHHRNEREYYKLVTKTHPELDELYRDFYRNERKTVPERIGKMLTPFALAVWFMDDGSKSKNAIYLNTQAFSVEEQFRLIKALRKFHLIFNLNRDGEYHRLRLLKRHNRRFLELVKPYILPEFEYKLPTP